jgi:Coenzyme PQQ synthesis protein D (PqqD)
MPNSFLSRVSAPGDVLVRELGGESVLLNLASETYFGLDDVGTRMWVLMTTAPSIQAAYDALPAEYSVAPEVLRRDMEALLGELLEHGLVELGWLRWPAPGAPSGVSPKSDRRGGRAGRRWEPAPRPVPVLPNPVFLVS